MTFVIVVVATSARCRRVLSYMTSRRRLLAGATGSALLLLPTARAAASPGQGEVYRRLRDLETTFDGRIGAYAVDTGTGSRVGYRERELFPLCSTFKALAAAAVLRRARRCDPGLLDRVIHWTQADVLPASPITAQHVADGMTVAQLCAAAIAVSDNTAGNMLLRQIGGPRGVTALARHLQDRYTRLDRWETDLNIWSPTEVRDTTTPSAVGRDFAALTVGRALVPEDRQRLIGWLRGSLTGGARIRAGLPTTWTVGDKTGTGLTYGAASDLAVAWPPAGAPLVLAVYTTGNRPDATADNQVIAATATVLARALGRL